MRAGTLRAGPADPSRGAALDANLESSFEHLPFAAAGANAAPARPGAATVSGDRDRLLIISPVRNEAAHIELLGRSVQRQSRPPDLWLVIDDGSTDATRDLLHGLSEEIPFMRVISTPPGHTADNGDRHAVAAAPRAFNCALRSVKWTEFTHVGKLDGDIELPDDYFARMLEEFDRDPHLGIGGGVLVEYNGSRWRTARTAPGHVRGALKLYRRECFEAIGGMREHLGWDGIDETYAQMRGYRTGSFDHIVARHHRAMGSAEGLLRGRRRLGESYHILGFSLPWSVLKALKLGPERPAVVSAVAFMYGYVRARCRSVSKVDDIEYVRFVRRAQRRRLVDATLRRGVRTIGDGSTANQSSPRCT